jgi:hypothetical protein
MTSNSDDDNHRLDESNGLSRVLPLDVATNLANYYRHITMLFVEYNVNSSVRRFARLAIDAYSIDAEGMESESNTKDLWQQLFMSQANLELYDSAYATLMAIPHADT